VAMVEQRIGTPRDCPGFAAGKPRLECFHSAGCSAADGARRRLSRITKSRPPDTVGSMLDVSVPLVRSCAQGPRATRRPQRKAERRHQRPQRTARRSARAAARVQLAEQGFIRPGCRAPATAGRSGRVNLDASGRICRVDPDGIREVRRGRAAVTQTGRSLEHPDLTPEDREKAERLVTLPGKSSRSSPGAPCQSLVDDSDAIPEGRGK
jgi:hypothetical protein